jgi:hypothetical protein
MPSYIHGGFRRLLQENSWVVCLFLQKKTYQHLAGLCRVLQKNVLEYSKAFTVRRTFLLLTQFVSKMELSIFAFFSL